MGLYVVGFAVGSALLEVFVSYERYVSILKWTSFVLLGLRSRGARRPRALGAGPLPHFCAELLADEGLRRHRGRGARHDDHALLLLLAILAGSPGREAGSLDARLDRNAGRSAGADQSDALRHLRRDGILERHQPVHHRQRRGDPERAWRHQHPNFRASRRGAAADRGGVHLRPFRVRHHRHRAARGAGAGGFAAPMRLARRLAGRPASTESRSTPRRSTARSRCRP